MNILSDDLLDMPGTSDGVFSSGVNGVARVRTIADRKVEFVLFEGGRVIALVKSEMGYPAYYPVHPVRRNRSRRS